MIYMTHQPKLIIGLLGYGVVGKGFYNAVKQTPGLNVVIKKIVIKHRAKARDVDDNLFIDDVEAVLQDDEINTVVELIDDAKAAYALVKKAMEKGKAVVSANKKMIAENFEALMYLQKQYRVPFLYEASCCASIPILRCLEEYFAFDEVKSIKGIINGSTNFILTKMLNSQLSFSEALAAAQKAGFAEANPALDVEGHDAANKFSILLAHGLGCRVHPREILYSGITHISKADIDYALKEKKTIKLLASAQKTTDGSVRAFVLPCFIRQDDELCHVKNELNALEVEGVFLGRQIFKGKGAGAYPTAAAVLSDVAAVQKGYQYPYRKLQEKSTGLKNDFLLDVYISADQLTKIKISDFKRIKEVQSRLGIHYVLGSIEAGKLLNTNWWKQKGVSLFVTEITYAQNNLPVSQSVTTNELAEISM